MRQEILNWWKQAEYDYDTALDNFKIKRYSFAAFLCQQAVEKALKALFLEENKGVMPQSHSLIYLASNTSLPHKYRGFLRDLTPKFVNTRYPDAASDLPYLIYDVDNTRPVVEGAGEVLKWIREKLKQK
jgi:HEPN domain-containing protein